MLNIEDIHTYYGDSYVLQGVSLEVRPRTAVALLGRNGMGKTTLIRSIIGFARPRQGRVLFDGQDITRLASHQIAHLGIGLVPQGRRIFPSLTVLEHLSVAARRGPWTACSGCIPGCGSATRTAAACSPGGSSRCWRSPARSRRTPGCC